MSTQADGSAETERYSLIERDVAAVVGLYFESVVQKVLEKNPNVDAREAEAMRVGCAEQVRACTADVIDAIVPRMAGNSLAAVLREEVEACVRRVRTDPVFHKGVRDEVREGVRNVTQQLIAREFGDRLDAAVREVIQANWKEHVERLALEVLGETLQTLRHRLLGTR